MTPSEKAKETRRKHEESRARKAQARERIREAIVEAMLSILADESATSAEKLQAAKILSEAK